MTNTAGTYDITKIIPTVRWSGDIRQVARSLDFGILSSPTDITIPKVDLPLGASVRMIEGGEALFDGFVITRAKGTEGKVVDASCFDRGFYLKKNKKTYQFRSQTPEAITAKVCADFNIPTGYITPTGFSLSRNFITGRDSLYDIIGTVYTLASATTKKAYHIGFRGPRLYVTEKAPDNRTTIIQGGSNLIAANTTESIESMVNVVKIIDSSGSEVRTMQDDSLIKLYGRMQDVLQQSKDNDRIADAKKLMDAGGVSQKITVDNLGNAACVAGGCVVVQEPHTGLYGLFYIESDVHEWKRGQYYNKLTLNFKAMMDEKAAGSLPNADGGKSKGNASIAWDYYNKPE